MPLMLVAITLWVIVGLLDPRKSVRPYAVVVAISVLLPILYFFFPQRLI